MKNRILLNHTIKVERLKLIFNSLIFSNVGQILASLLLSFLLRDAVSRSVIYIWLAVIIISSLVGIFVKLMFRSQLKTKINNTKNWENLFLFIVSLNAICWGAAGFVLFAENLIVEQSLLILTIAGVVAASISIISPHYKAIFIFVPTSILPLLVKILLNQGQYSLELAGLGTIFFVISMLSSLNFNKRFNEILALKYESQEHKQKHRESEEKYRLLYEQSEDPMMIFSDMKFSMANKAAVNLFGYESEEELLKVPAFTTSPKYQPDGQKSIDKAVNMSHELFKKGHARLEWNYKKSDGEVRPADATLTVVKYGESNAIFCIIRDISKMKKIEQGLIRSKRASDEASNAKSDFLANISHEIRTPMNGVIGTTELLLNNPLVEEQKNRALTIKKSAKSMLRILNEILDYSKIEAGMLELESHEFNLNDLVEEFRSSIINRITNKNLEFNYKIDKELNSWFYGDSGRILQILNNILDNAVKFTHEGSIFLTCQLIQRENRSAIVRFMIKDSGIGINSEKKKEVFDRFRQADGSTTRKYGGTGLGLNICKQLVVLMGGDIDFKSQVGKGTVFWFTIKLTVVEEPVKVNPQISSEFHQFNAFVLIVDDNDTNQHVAKGMLDLFGIKSDVVNNGEKAIKACKKKNYDLILMDCHMPVMDGYHATKMIRRTGIGVLNNKIPIVAMTASAMQGDKEKCIAYGMDDYLTKPIDINVLEKKLHDWLPSKTIQSKKEVTPITLNAKHEVTQVKTPYFDISMLMEKLAGNIGLIDSIAINFISSLSEQVDSMEDAMSRRDFSQMISDSHRIKGSSSTMGCLKLSDLANEIELAAKDGDEEKIQLLKRGLRDCYLETKKALENKLKEFK